MVSLTLTLLLLIALALGIWALWRGFELSRRQGAPRVTPQVLDSLAQPYRQLMGEAVAIERDVRRQIEGAPRPMQRNLNEIAERTSTLVARAMPRARQGTALAAYLLRLKKDEAQYLETESAAKEIEKELSDFVAHLRMLRGRLYGVLASASRLSPEGGLKDELEDTLIELEALETAFQEARQL